MKYAVEIMKCKVKEGKEAEVQIYCEKGEKGGKEGVKDVGN